MGRHSAERMSVRELRSSYNRLLEAYGRLLRDHRRLEAEHLGLPETAPQQPSTEVELWRPAGHLATGYEPLSVNAACELVRASGLLTSAGG
jgi:hypothetical protein